MTDSIPMTQDGYDRIHADIKDLEDRRPAIKTAIEEAREKGDLRENADYHAAREELAMLDAKIAQLHGKLANSRIIDPANAPPDIVSVFKTVTFRCLRNGREMKRTLVGEGEADPAQGRILANSPIGQALIGKRIGDKAVAELPAGPMELEILSIE